MKKMQFTFPLLALTLLTACSKKYTCSHSFDYRYTGVSLVGFTSTELNEVIVRKYAANTNFQTVVSADTFTESDIIFSGDAAYLNTGTLTKQGFAAMEPGTDIKISVTSVGQEYTITEVRKTGDSESWEQSEHCSPGSTMASTRPYAFKLDGIEGTATLQNYGFYMAFIQR